MTQTQEIIIGRVSKLTNGYEGMCMSGGKFLKESQVRYKIIGWIFFQFTFNLSWMTQTQEIITCRVSKFKNGYEGMYISWGQFLKESQVRNKIIGWIIFQFTFNLIQMTQSQEIITCRIWKFMNVYEGMCMSGGKFRKEWQVRNKIIGWFFSNCNSTFYKWLKLRKY